jgi:hypothetical protein
VVVKEDKMKTTKKGKAIVGIAMAAIVEVNTVLKGQDLQFPSGTTWTTTPPQVMRYESGDLSNIYTATVGNDGNYYVYNVNWPTTGDFFVNGGPEGHDAQLSYEEPKMPLKLKVEDKVVSSIARTTPLTIDVGGINLDDNDVVDLVIIGPKGQIAQKDGQPFKGITVSTLKNMKIDTTGWDIGHYTFQIKTKPEKACGLDEQSPKRELDMIKGTVEIKADTTEVPELKVVKLTVTGVAGHHITVKADPLTDNAYFPAGIDNNPGGETTNKFNDTIDDDGTRTYAVEFNDTGAFTIRVDDHTEEGSYDTVDITVTEKQVIFDVPDSVRIGEKFTIRGTANTGDTVTVAVDDEVVPKLDCILLNENGEFEVEIDTSAADMPAAFKVPGSARLRAFIDRVCGIGDISTEKDDGAATVFMLNEAGGGIDISASVATVGKNETIILTIDAVPEHNVSVTTADTAHTVFEYNRYDFTGTSSNMITVAPADTVSIPTDIGDCDSQTNAMNISGVLNTMVADGTIRFAVHFADTGTYKITATDYGTGYPTATLLDEEDIEITVIEKNVTFDMPSIVVVGDTLTVKGTAKSGDTVTVAVDGEVVQKLDQIVIDGNGEFEVEIDTSSEDAPAGFQIPSAVKLKAYTDRSGGSGSIGPDEIDDGSTEVFMVRPWLTASLSTDLVDPGNEFTISGTAKGTKSVDMLIVAPKGYSGTNIEDSSQKEMYIGSTGVSTTDGTLSKKISVGDDVDTGRYLVVVLSKGSDGVYGCDSSGMTNGALSQYSVASPTPTPPTPTPTPGRRGKCRGGVTIEEALDCYSLKTRTQNEMLAVFDDIVALGDDLIWVRYIAVGKQETLILNPIVNLEVGDSLEVTGETSREDGSRIWITVKGRYYEIVPQTAIASDNTFSATFDTTGVPPVTYTVKAMDGYGYTAARIVNIIAGVNAHTSLYSDAVGSYLGISGTQTETITIQKMYTYPCAGTGGHSEYAAFYAQNGTKLGEGFWDGYQDEDYPYITFDAPFTLEIGKTYDYTIKTGSYPQIIHGRSHTTDNGTITCTEFTDANGNKYNDYIPAIRLE